jgi:ferredoxin-NADP reductase
MPQKFQCVIKRIVAHTERVYTVILEPDRSLPRFLPGQFLHLALDPYTPGNFWPDSRAFSIASSPSERRELRITYAAKGRFTTRMESELAPGREVWAKLPYGEFTIKTDRASCLLAGGTGITAFTAFLSDLPPEYSQDIYLLYGARLPNLLIYRPLVDLALKSSPRLQVYYFAEQLAAGTDCTPGRIDLERVWSSFSDPSKLTYYIAGPPVMLKIFTEGLLQRGVKRDKIVIDAWE